MRAQHRFAVTTLIACLAACAAEPEEQAPSACDEAAAHLLECGIVDSPPEAACTDDAVGAQILETPCDDLATELNDNKSDGFLDGVMCALGFELHCPPPDAVYDGKTRRWNRYDFDTELLHPEGGIFDPVERAFYVGSLTNGSVTRVDALTGELWVVSPVDTDKWRTLGVDVDPAARRLFVCALHDVEPLHGEVWEYDLATFERIRHDLTLAAPGGSCNDLAAAPDGSVYVTDREQPNIYRVDPSSGEVTLFVSDRILEKPSLGIGQNGIVILPDGAGIMTTTYLLPALNHISMDEPPQVTRVEISGDFHDYTSLGAGADGMILHDGALYVAFSSELIRVDRNDDWLSVTATSTNVRSGMTDVIAAEGDLYLLNGQAVSFIRGKDPGLPFSLLLFDGDQ